MGESKLAKRSGGRRHGRRIREHAVYASGRGVLMRFLCYGVTLLKDGAGTSGTRRGSPWKPFISTSSSKSDGGITVLGMPPCAERNAPSAEPAKPPAEFCM